jgi:hypothetical protein
MAQVHFDGSRVSELANVGTGDKALLAPGQHDGTNLFISGQRAKMLGELFAYSAVQGVFGFWARDTQECDSVVADFEADDWLV